MSEVSTLLPSLVYTVYVFSLSVYMSATAGNAFRQMQTRQNRRIVRESDEMHFWPAPTKPLPHILYNVYTCSLSSNSNSEMPLEPLKLPQ